MIGGGQERGAIDISYNLLTECCGTIINVTLVPELTISNRVVIHLNHHEMSEVVTTTFQMGAVSDRFVIQSI